MIEATARVVEAGAGYAILELQRASACGSCHSQTSCGSAALAKVWGNKSLRVRAISTLSLQPGERVVVGLADGMLVRAAMLVYLLPILLLITGAILAQLSFASAGEELVIMCGALGLGLGLGAARILAQRWRNDPRLQPVVLRSAIQPPITL